MIIYLFIILLIFYFKFKQDEGSNSIEMNQLNKELSDLLMKIDGFKVIDDSISDNQFAVEIDAENQHKSLVELLLKFFSSSEKKEFNFLFSEGTCEEIPAHFLANHVFFFNFCNY